MYNRRKFLQQGAMAAAAACSSNALWAAENNETQTLTILHTNDVHSRLEPFPMDGGRNQGLGGVAERAAIIAHIRAKEKNVLLLDAGDIFQGTPYFNMFKGEPEIKAMSAMGYDATTMGNHDFDGGLDNFAVQVKQHAKFPVLLCNYGFDGTEMEHLYEPWKIVKKGKLKIGITGVGIKMKGLVPDTLCKGVEYLDPVSNASRVAEKLKKDKGCDMVICLSHLGYKYKEDINRMSDIILARESEHIDLIIGGHTHTFLDEPELVKNNAGSDVIINQAGWAGILLGRLDFEFGARQKKNLTKSHTVVVSKKTNE
jgi:5'-nucleotidase